MPKQKAYMIFLLFGCLCLCHCQVTLSETQSPNIILILTDDQGWTHTSHRADPHVAASVSDYYETPNMDRLASSGLLFTQGYAPNPICSPTRHSILFGQNAARHIYNRDTNWYKHTADWLTIPRVLKKENPAYETAHFGKWHVAMTPSDAGYDRDDGMTSNAGGEIFGDGFLNVRDYTGMTDEFLLSHNVPNPTHARRAGKPSGHWDHQNAKDIFGITQRAKEFMKSSIDAGKPFYVQLSHYAAHLSLVSRKETYSYFKDKALGLRHTNPEFAAMLKDLDEGVGQIMDFIREEGIQENTYIFLMGDNGGRRSLNQIAIIGEDKTLIDAYYSTQHQRNLPLRDGKHSFYEGGLRVPFIVAGPGISANRTSSVPVTGLDLLPTFSELAGGKIEMPPEIDGGSLIPLLFDEGQADPKRQIPYLIFHQASHRRPRSAIRKGAFKLIKYWTKESKYDSAPKVELYNILDDLSESQNIVEKHPDVVQELEAALLDYLTLTGAEVAERDILGPFYRLLNELKNNGH